jgi:hypothetical protein
MQAPGAPARAPKKPRSLDFRAARCLTFEETESQPESKRSRLDALRPPPLLDLTRQPENDDTNDIVVRLTKARDSLLYEFRDEPQVLARLQGALLRADFNLAAPVL